MRLLNLELKRVIKTRLTIILLSLAIFLSIIMAYLPVTYQYASYTDDLGNTVTMTGKDAIEYKKRLQKKYLGEVTPAKVKEAVILYQNVLEKYGVTETYELPDGVYNDEILAFAPLIHGVKEAYADPNTGVAPSIMDIDPQDLDNYYDAIKGRLESLMKIENPNHPAIWQEANRLYDSVSVPYMVSAQYSSDAMDYLMLLLFLVMCICAVLSAPIFTSDYQTGADDILRCTKHGRVRFALTKIVSALIICSTITVTCAVIYIIVSNSLFGWESTKTSMHMVYSITSLLDYDISKLQLFTASTGLLSIFATVCLILFISSKCKNVVVSLSVSMVLCLLPNILYLAIPASISHWAYGFIPSSGAGIQTSMLYSAIDFIFFCIGDIAIWLPYAMICACIIEIPILICLTLHSYIRHQAVA